MRLTWLADVLRAEGLRVVETEGWQSRGKDLDSVEGVVLHHTATGPDVPDGRVDTLLIVGRSDLAGPLCQLGLRRDGTFVVIAGGKGNHNGYGDWGNQSIGIEAYNDGVGEKWSREQLDAYQRGTAAILRRLGLGADKARGHRETDPRRKVDPAGIDLPAFRATVATLIDRSTDHSTGDLTVADIDKILERLEALELRVIQIQQETVGTIDQDGKSRMDRLAKTIDGIAADVKD
jgi:hypothetical protein